ncbi:MAG TPA: tetratricopeptide repeat protein [Candidatus Cloacimonadota bacterium]|nr:tetratricopeptide repeat protein [Candidatus Cloacimonadota bacterium]
MKKLILTFTLIGLIAGMLFADVEKIAIVNFMKNDRQCDYVYQEMTKRDFKTVFEEDANLELIDMKIAEKAFQKTGYSYMGRDEALALGTEMAVDFIIWGSLGSGNNNDFQVQLNVYSMQTKDVFPIRFNVTKNKDERRQAIKDNLISKIAASGEAEVQKMMDIGLQQFNSKNLPAAEEAFLNLIKIDPENVDAYLYLGVIKYLNQDYEASVEFYEKGLELDPENVTLLDYLSKSYLKMESYEDAVAALEKIAAQDESNKEIWLRIGNIYAEIEYYSDAQEAYENALEIDSEYAEVWMELGVLLYDQEMFDEAIVPLEHATDAFPDIDHLQKKLAKCYLKTGKLDSAIAKYQHVLIEQPENINAYINLAQAYRITNQNQEALTTLLKLKEIAPDLPKVYLRLADTYIALKNYPKAEAMTDKATELDSSQYESYLIKAQIKFDLGYQKYEKFLWYEEEYKDKSKYYGEAADKLVEERDQVKQEAHNYFIAEDKLLSQALSMTTDPSELKDIKSKQDLLKQLKNATKPGGF